VFGSVCAFLAVDAVAPRTERRIKDKETPVVPPRARRLLAPLKALVAPYRQTSAFVAARALIARRLRYPPLTSELRNRLLAYYADDTALLAELLGRDLSIWRGDGASDDAAAGAARPLSLAPAEAGFASGSCRSRPA
jgi:hypothetical protein